MTARSRGASTARPSSDIGRPKAPARQHVARDFQTGRGTVVRCRPYMSVLMVFAPVRRLNCVHLSDPVALQVNHRNDWAGALRRTVGGSHLPGSAH